jgi:hypothetical protein
MTNVIKHPANQPHWEGPVRCMLCGAEHRAVAPVIEWAEGSQPVDCGSCKGVRSCIEVDTSESDWEAVKRMTPEELDANLRAQGIDPEESAARGRALVAKLSEEHKARSRMLEPFPTPDPADVLRDLDYLLDEETAKLAALGVAHAAERARAKGRCKRCHGRGTWDEWSQRHTAAVYGAWGWSYARHQTDDGVLSVASRTIPCPDCEEHRAREYTARDTADFELEHMEVMIRDCWQKLYGTREWPRNMNRRRALGRIRDIIVTSIEPIAGPPKPPHRLPLGVVRDDEPN